MSKIKFFSKLIILMSSILIYSIINEYSYVDTAKFSHSNINYEYPKTFNTLVVLVEFNNSSLVGDEHQWYNHLFETENSITNYYQENSYNKLNVRAATGSVHKVTLDLKHPNFDSDSELEDIDLYFEEILKSLDGEIDYQVFDTNNNRYIESDELAVIFVMAGQEETFSNTEYDTSGSFVEASSIKLDGVTLSTAILIGEMSVGIDSEHFTTIGVFCHELGHALGLPDLYDIDYSSQGLGYHELMASGTDNYSGNQELGESPAPLSAWSKEFLGLIEPIKLSEDGIYRLPKRINSDIVYKIEDGDLYYLIEYVTFDGYGAGLASHTSYDGMAVWQVNTNVINNTNMYYNEINNDEDQYGVMLIEANGDNDLLNPEFDYWYTLYNHYFNVDKTSEIELPNGDYIEIITQTDEYLEIEFILSD